jgi:hypothetical protein
MIMKTQALALPIKKPIADADWTDADRTGVTRTDKPEPSPT